MKRSIWFDISMLALILIASIAGTVPAQKDPARVSAGEVKSAAASTSRVSRSH